MAFRQCPDMIILVVCSRLSTDNVQNVKLVHSPLIHIFVAAELNGRPEAEYKIGLNTVYNYDVDFPCATAFRTRRRYPRFPSCKL